MAIIYVTYINKSLTLNEVFYKEGHNYGLEVAAFRSREKTFSWQKYGRYPHKLFQIYTIKIFHIPTPHTNPIFC